MNFERKHDYCLQMEDDIYNWIESNGFNINRFKSKDDAFEYMTDILWANDSITGNGACGYLNDWYCKNYVSSNIDLAIDACEEFMVSFDKLREWKKENKLFINLDATIRCYLLDEVVDKILDHLYEKETNK